MQTVIYEDEYLKVIYKSRNSSTLVITFGDMGTLADNNNTYADKPLQKLNLSNLGFMAKTPNWYPQQAMLKSFEKIHYIIQKYNYIVGYSNSMGAYALIKYSKKLSLNKVIALVPQYSINPMDIQDNRYKEYFKPNLNKNMTISIEDLCSNCLYLLIYDKYFTLDNQNAKLIDIQLKTINAKVNHIFVNYTGHHISKILANSSMLNSFITEDIFSNNLFKKIKYIKRQSEFFLNTSFPLFYKRLSTIEIINNNGLSNYLNNQNRRLFEYEKICKNLADKNIPVLLKYDYLLTHHSKILCYNLISKSLEAFDLSVIQNNSETIFPILPHKGHLCFNHDGRTFYLYYNHGQVIYSSDNFLINYIILAQVEFDNFAIYDCNGNLLAAEKNGLCNFRSQIISSWETYKKVRC